MNFFDVHTCNEYDLFNTDLGVIKDISEEDKEVFAEKLCEVLKFPYFSKDEIDFDKEIKRLHNYNIKNILLENDELQQVMFGLNVVNYYHPHMFDIKCKNMKTPMDIFNDKVLLKKAILKRIKMSTCSLKPYALRKMLSLYSGVQKVSNFRPTIAKFIYDTYAPADAEVLDPCMGYGGRLLGALTSKNVSTYYACDPCVRTFECNQQMVKDLSGYCDNKSVYLTNLPYEDSIYKKCSMDLVFTSPPYFNLERYSDEPTQSYIRYPTYDKWKTDFLYVMIKKSYNYLKSNSYFVFNVHGKDIIKDSIDYAKSINFIHEKTLNMRLSRTCGKGIDKNKEKFKFEPVLIFKKT